jgi:hypothetical protein
MRLVVITESGARRAIELHPVEVMATPCQGDAADDVETIFLPHAMLHIDRGAADPTDNLFEADLVEVARTGDGEVCLRAAGSSGSDRSFLRADRGALSGEIRDSRDLVSVRCVSH